MALTDYEVVFLSIFWNSLMLFVVSSCPLELISGFVLLIKRNFLKLAHFDFALFWHISLWAHTHTHKRTNPHSPPMCLCEPESEHYPSWFLGPLMKQQLNYCVLVATLTGLQRFNIRCSITLYSVLLTRALKSMRASPQGSRTDVRSETTPLPRSLKH